MGQVRESRVFPTLQLKRVLFKERDMRDDASFSNHEAISDMKVALVHDDSSTVPLQVQIFTPMVQ